jgi:hypothetical protein
MFSKRWFLFPQMSAKFQVVIHCLILGENCYVNVDRNLNCYVLM